MSSLLIAEIKKIVKDSEIMKSVLKWKTLVNDLTGIAGKTILSGQRRIKTAGRN